MAAIDSVTDLGKLATVAEFPLQKARSTLEPGYTAAAVAAVCPLWRARRSTRWDRTRGHSTMWRLLPRMLSSAVRRRVEARFTPDGPVPNGAGSEADRALLRWGTERINAAVWGMLLTLPPGVIAASGNVRVVYQAMVGAKVSS